MNEHEIQRIAAALNQLRPDWPTKQLRTLLSDARMVDRPRRDVAVALAWVACEPNSASPYRVLEAGPWWKATAGEGETRGPRPPKPHEACPDCGKDKSTCPCKPRERSPIASEHLATLRAERAAAVSAICTHGPNCRLDHDETEESA